MISLSQHVKIPESSKVLTLQRLLVQIKSPYLFLRTLAYQYQLIRLLSVISKLLESVTNKKVVDHVNRNNQLNMEYGFCYSRSAADGPVRESVRHSIINACQRPLTRCDIGGSYTDSPAMESLRVLAILKSFLSDSS